MNFVPVRKKFHSSSFVLLITSELQWPEGARLAAFGPETSHSLPLTVALQSTSFNRG